MMASDLGFNVLKSPYSTIRMNNKANVANQVEKFGLCSKIFRMVYVAEASCSDLAKMKYME